MSLRPRINQRNIVMKVPSIAASVWPSAPFHLVRTGRYRDGCRQPALIIRLDFHSWGNNGTFGATAKMVLMTHGVQRM
jgi:hypothetical protein